MSKIEIGLFTRKEGILLAHSLKTLPRRLFRDDVVDYIIDCILRKRFLPGDRVLENQIAEELAIGKGAVREALRDLVGMGFLESEAYKGTRVRLCCLEDLHHYYQARIDLVHILTLRIFGDLAGKGLDRQRLGEIIEAMVVSSKEGEYLNQVKLDLIFHRIYAEGAGNPYLVKAWVSLEHYYWVSLHVQVGSLEGFHQAEKHYAFLEAIDSSDPERISALQTRNLQKVVAEFGPIFVKRGLLRP